MRAWAILVVAAASVAAVLPQVASAAELDLPTNCPRGQVWNNDRCEWVRPRVSEAPPVYQAPPAYVAEEEIVEEPVYVARPYYVAPTYYVAPYYRRPVVTYYAGPRYGYGWGGYGRRYAAGYGGYGHGHGGHGRWR